MRKFLSAPKMVTLLFSLLSITFSTLAQKPIPELWGQRVHDEAKSLSGSTVDQLEKQLKRYQDSTGNQIAVLIITSLNEEPIEDYSIRAAEKWKLGNKKNDNGVLLIVSVDDHKMRIEVGEGLEGVLTDAVSSQIIRNEMAPNFRRGDYDAGITAAVNAIIKAIGGEYKSTNVNDDDSSSTSNIFTGIVIFGLLGFFTYSALFSSGCAGWGVYFFLFPFYAFLPWIVIGKSAAVILFGIYVIGFPIIKMIIGRTAWGKAKIKTWSAMKTSGGGSSFGGFLGGGGFFSGGGGGFSGGGGSFGGGGASGSW